MIYEFNIIFGLNVFNANVDEHALNNIWI